MHTSSEVLEAARRQLRSKSQVRPAIMSATPIKILVIDDEFPIRKHLRIGLGKQGYEILEAPNGKAAMGLLAQTPDLITLDLDLPDISGLELLQMIRTQYENIPVVVLSGRDDGVSKVHAFDIGADDYVTKPFGMEELLARIRTALRHQLQVQGERPIFRVSDLSVDLVSLCIPPGGRALAEVVDSQIVRLRLWSLHFPSYQRF